MKRFVIISILFAFCILLPSSLKAEGEWKIYASYHNATKAVKMGGRVYVLANGDLFSYDPEDTSVETYDKTNTLSDFGIYDIAYCSATKSLVILYSNGNIDIMDSDSECVNISELKNAGLGSKAINELCIEGAEAFISTKIGLVIVNLKDFYFKDTYKFSSEVKQCLANDKVIYVKTTNGTYMGDRSVNLLNANNWKLLTSAQLNADAVYKSLKNENQKDEALLASVSKVVPDSPIRNYSYKLNTIGNRLLVAGGSFYYPGVSYTGTAMKYEGGRWTFFDETAPLDAVGKLAYQNITDIVQDPNDSEHHFLSSQRSGLYEFRNYKMVKHYAEDNSPLSSILPNDPYHYTYVRTTALNYDRQGNLWMCNNETDTIFKVLKADGTWKVFYFADLKGKPTWDNTFFDSRGWSWSNCRRTTNAYGPSGILIINANGTIDDQSDDQYRFLSSFSNQDGTSYSPDLWYCAVEDLDGTMWLGNTHGVFVTNSPGNVFDKDFYLTQIKVPRNDGSNLADYLLNNVPVKCIAVDGANRKWIGTENNGVYLISADGLESLEHFTKDNSPLISDIINDIAIDGATGEVFIATEAGLCSYLGDATDASETMTSNILKVYPNPVRPEYSGDVHITGLAYNSNVKIVNAGGKLVHEGMSNGGQFVWNCCTKTGNRVSSGIYYALCTDAEGKKGACAKILIVR